MTPSDIMLSILMDEDMIQEQVKERRTWKTKMWSNKQLVALEKLCIGGPGSLLMTEFKSLMNSIVCN